MPDIPIPDQSAAYAEAARGPETAGSGVSWPAIIGGAVAAIALALVLLSLGAGLGLASVSPWPGAGASVTTFTITTAVWLIVMHWLASGLGGYITGRLRTKWVGLHTHEVFFRDTANGFLAWAVASVVGAAFLAMAASSVVGGAASLMAGAASSATPGAPRSAPMSTDPTAYLIDSLFRTDHPAEHPADVNLRAQTSRILLHGMLTGDMPASDNATLAQLVTAQTGLSQPDAAKRVDDIIAQEKAADAKTRQAADAARKAGSYLSIFTALAMLIGAFVACVAAALGGQQRDQY
jgi:hypothetical protein